MSNQEVTVHQGTDLTLAGSATIGDLRTRMQQMKQMIELKRDFLQDNLKEGIDKDYAVIPGTQKKSLLKPGAEKMLDWHGYYATFELCAEKEDWDVGLFAYTYRCVIRQRGSNIVIGDCEGDCSTMESKYRFEWKFQNELPAGTDVKTLIAKTFTRRDGTTFTKYQVIVANGADKRNTVRKMAQKRAFIGATVMATATSDLFTSDEPDEEDSQASGSNATSTEHSGETKKDYGPLISEAQGKRLYAIRSSKKIDNNEFRKWLKSKYGLDSDKEIGRNIYEEICTACESGHLEMPKPDPKPEPHATETATPAPQGDLKLDGAAPSATLSVPQIKSLNLAIHDNKRTEKQFLDFLATFDPKYQGKKINDILAEDFERLMTAWDKAITAGAV